jgi:glutamine amidotransferase
MPAPAEPVRARTMIDIAVVDYGTGNLRSVAKAFAHVAPGARVAVTSDAGEIAAARRVVLPGQSAMPDCMQALRDTGLAGAVVEAASRRPFLGICLGLQMLFELSEEGPAQGLGVLRGRVVRFRDEAMALPDGTCLKIPHMGWSRVRQVLRHPLWEGVPDGSRFYFAHSFHAVPSDPSIVAGTVDYPNSFTCAIARANIFAVQFHPEKSQRAGLRLLQNFVSWDGAY